LKGISDFLHFLVSEEPVEGEANGRRWKEGLVLLQISWRHNRKLSLVL
jgi:hypothetical protein